MRPQKLQLADLTVDYMSILSTQSKTRDTDEMVYQVVKQIESIKDIDWWFDETGNIYVVKGKAETYPSYVAHLDTVHDIKEGYKAHYDPDHDVFYATRRAKSDFEQTGVGGDDKCGIIACIELLHRLKAVKCAFFVDEEAGCQGSAKGDLTFFDNCRFAIQIDRRNGGDAITSGCGTKLCSTEFEDLLNQVGKTYGYKTTTGASTDVVKLKDRGMGISACNLSSGYYHPHSSKEYIVASELLNCIQFSVALSRFKNTFAHKPAKKSYPAASQSNSSSFNRGPWNGNSTNNRYSNKLGKKPDESCAECGGGLSAAEKENRLHTKCFRELFLEDQIPFKSVVTNEETKKNS